MLQVSSTRKNTVWSAGLRTPRQLMSAARKSTCTVSIVSSHKQRASQRCLTEGTFRSTTSALPPAGRAGQPKIETSRSCLFVDAHRHVRVSLYTHCNTLQHTATHCNTLQHTSTHCNMLQHTISLYTHLP